MNPKKLSLREMWELYKLLGASKGNPILIDEVAEMMQVIPPANIAKSIKMFYGKVPDTNPLGLVLLFVDGLQQNHFFEFQTFMEKLL